MDLSSKKHKFQELLNFIKDIGQNLNNRLSSKKILSNNKKDIKILADIELNNQITTFLEQNFNYEILSEENINSRNFLDYKELVWIVDPLDGSLNFSRGIEHCCISISLWDSKNFKSIFSCIFNILNSDMYVSYNDKALLNDNLISVSNIDSIKSGILCTGFPSYGNYDFDYLQEFISRIQNWKKIRAIGSAAISLSWVACGKVDGYIEENIRIWDVAAGISLVQSAGGNVFMKENNEKNFVTVIATNHKISVESLKGNY